MSRSRGPQSPATRYHDDFDAYDYGNYDQYERDDYYDGENGGRDGSRGGTAHEDYDMHDNRKPSHKGNVNFGGWEGDDTYEALPRRVHQIEIEAYPAHEDTKYSYRDEGRRSTVRTREPSPVKRVRDEERGSPIKGSIRDDRMLRDPRSGSGRHTEESSPVPPPPPPNGYPGFTSAIHGFHPTPGQKKAMQDREKQRENENSRGLVVKNTTISIGPTPVTPAKKNFDHSPDHRPVPPQHAGGGPGPVKAILNAIKLTNNGPSRDTLPRGEDKVSKENQHERREDIKLLSAQSKVSTNPFMKSNDRKSGGASMRQDATPTRPHNVHEVVHKMNTGDWPIKIEDGGDTFRDHRHERSYSRAAVDRDAPAIPAHERSRRQVNDETDRRLTEEQRIREEERRRDEERARQLEEQRRREDQMKQRERERQDERKREDEKRREEERERERAVELERRHRDEERRMAEEHRKEQERREEERRQIDEQRRREEECRREEERERVVREEEDRQRKLAQERLELERISLEKRREEEKLRERNRPEQEDKEGRQSADSQLDDHLHVRGASLAQKNAPSPSGSSQGGDPTTASTDSAMGSDEMPPPMAPLKAGTMVRPLPDSIRELNDEAERLLLYFKGHREVLNYLGIGLSETLWSHMSALPMIHTEIRCQGMKEIPMQFRKSDRDIRSLPRGEKLEVRGGTILGGLGGQGNVLLPNDAKDHALRRPSNESFGSVNASLLEKALCTDDVNEGLRRTQSSSALATYSNDGTTPALAPPLNLNAATERWQFWKKYPTPTLCSRTAQEQMKANRSRSGRFVKKSAAAIIAKKQYESGSPLQGKRTPNGLDGSQNGIQRSASGNEISRGHPKSMFAYEQLRRGMEDEREKQMREDQERERELYGRPARGQGPPAKTRRGQASNEDDGRKRSEECKYDTVKSETPNLEREAYFTYENNRKGKMDTYPVHPDIMFKRGDIAENDQLRGRDAQPYGRELWIRDSLGRRHSKVGHHVISAYQSQAHREWISPYRVKPARGVPVPNASMGRSVSRKSIRKRESVRRKDSQRKQRKPRAAVAFSQIFTSIF